MRLKNINFGIRVSTRMILLLAVVAAAIPAMAGGMRSADLKASGAGLAEEVRHQLVMLPYYSVFDNLEYDVQDGGVVVLSGQVTRPTLKSDAANAVRTLGGVNEVVNNIEVLPLSRYDDRIRIALYRALFANTRLDRYAIQAVPPIHIIVKNANITLVGVVASEADKNVAGVVASSVPGTFSVTNKLDVGK
jgi:hyperosmotically inducible protein